MDIARRPYSTDARFFKDSDQVVRIKWYPAKEPVECLNFTSAINSLDWSSHPYLAAGVGEVFGATRPYNAAEVIPYAHGLTPCEPAEVFAEGEEFDPERAPQKYDEKGFPLCCLNHVTMEGGVEWNGSAVSHTNFSCPDAEQLELPAHVLRLIPYPSARWWKFNQTAGKTYRFIMFQVWGNFPFQSQAFEGPCNALVMKAVGVPGFTDWVASYTGLARISMTYEPGIPPNPQPAPFEFSIEELP